MTDWADNEATYLPMYNKAMRPHLATMLRKAKATGIRDAIAVLEKCGDCQTSPHIAELRALAAKVEKGEA